ncbi:MAG: 2-oxo acid dehydrogenase subunit E2 [Chloroflexi bacterium]|jgi:pyruvate dehydrogenase E2 component (dihydrolipoamide acetyltransferase)|nr:2-oxo acid dehydrogenase subunit E2 [Chloroflexota bacterium]
MATDVIMPKVDMDQETGTVGQWLKKEGDEVKQGETILEIETDKVAIDVEAPASGILSGILVGEGETVPIATIIAYILEPGEALPVGTKPAEPAQDEPPKIDGPVQQTDWEVPVTPVARNLAAASGIDPSAVTGSGPRGRVTKKDVEEALAAPSPSGNGQGKVYATPAARRIARERDVVLGNISGSGPGSRIQAADVLAEADRLAETVAPAAILSPEVDVVPLRGMRRTIAERMTASYQQAPHIGFTWRNDMTRFNEARAQLNARAEKAGSPRISATALMVKIVGSVLARHPWLNSSFQGEDIHLYRDINIGVAVALETGLIVPVVHDVTSKGVSEIAKEVKDLSLRARDGQLIPAEVRGGTFTISNLGPFGVEQFNAIINPPEAAILAVGATQNAVVAGEDGQVLVRPLMHITLTVDHRVVDGAVAAHFIEDLKSAMEAPVLLLL